MRKILISSVVFLGIFFVSVHLIAGGDENALKFFSGWFLFAVSILGPAYVILHTRTHYPI